MRGNVVQEGDMHKSVYDINNNGKVDTAENAEQLGGQLPAYYATATAIAESKKLLDPITGKKYILGVENGLLYFDETI